ncbi:DNA internalization-related competence protein ComEC/Rec2 [Nitrosomonas sp. JL21]|nr:DNA internalization-related competence protein ComEC/Rec2 [Nitrosomonas sp.]MCC7091383.1 DNA internalization-related competence protein ComEC/Rec2 [Nitrosomonas sp.]MXS76808.1 DNA internalization-related competence protein ComEC/Rec2 [Nitrosomonas sp. JL21]
MMWAWSLVGLVIGVKLLMRFQSLILSMLNDLLIAVLCAGLGFFWAATVAHWRLSDSLPPQWEQRDIQIIGVVANLPHRHDLSARFLLDVEHVITESAIVPRRIVLSWYPHNSSNHDETIPSMVKAGQRWQFTVRLKQPHGNANPHGFDYEAWALERDIRATGYIRSSVENELLDTLVNHPRYWIEHLREAIQRRFDEKLPNHTYAGVLKALAVGDQNAIPRDQWEVFMRTGTIHLMAISGLHITLVSSLIFIAVYAVWRCYPGLVMRVPARRAAVVAGFIAAFGYAVLSGLAIPAQRTLYMLTVVVIAVWRGKSTSPVTVLSWALLWVVLVDPWATLAPGFWLSFGAIAIIMWVTVGRIGSLHWLVNWVRIQWAISLGLIPLLLIMFQQLSLISPVANAIAIPLVSFLVVPLTLLATVPVFDFMLPFAHAAMSLLMLLMHWLSSLPQAVWEQPAPPAWTILIALVGIGWMLLPGSFGWGFFSGFPARWIGITALIPMLLVQSPRPQTGEFWLTVLDVGQGLAVVVRTRHHTLLFDTGPRFGTTDSGKQIIVPFLRGEGIRKLDALIVSHADMDHSGGALSVMSAMPVRTLISSLNQDHPITLATGKDGGNYPCRLGHTWLWDEVQFELLHSSDVKRTRKTTNASSCVLKITSAHGSALLPSDIGSADESMLLAEVNDKLPATVLIAPHHGSHTSSTKAFVEKVNPALTVFPVGYHNRYRHPRDAVLSRYHDIGSQILRTDADGAILLRFENKAWFVESWRKSHRRYWHPEIRHR